MIRAPIRPPGLSRWLLARAARRLDAPELLPDADELFTERLHGHGEAAARRWYRRQARAALARLLLPRREGRQARPGRRPGEGGRSRGRAGRWLASLGGFSLDARLGARMLVKHPAVTLVGGLAMTIGIGLGAGYFELITDITDPTLPFSEGERIVGIRNWDPLENDPAPRASYDFLIWREELESVRDLGAFQSLEQNLALADGPGEPARGARISASAFPITGVSPVVGRPLTEADEDPSAPPVILLGHEVWQRRFSADPAIVGRTVRVGSGPHTVVGVMPEGYAFPLNHHFWVPLRSHELSAYGPGDGPALSIFGRLAPGASLDEARAELTALGSPTAAMTGSDLRPQVMKYPQLFVGEVTGGGGSGRGAHLAQLLFVTLLLVLASNVAVMVFARTATRENEIAVRFALGSSHARILGQFFVEALVLALGATAIALAAVAAGADWLTRWVWQISQGQAPFWVDARLNGPTVLYALLLAVVGSVMAGVVPALKTTGGGLQTRLRHAAGGGGSALRFGGAWSAMIVVQVVLAVLVLPPAVVAISALAEPGYVEPGFPAEEYLSARVAIEREQPAPDSAAERAFHAQFEQSWRELERRLRSEPEVRSVAVATRLPVMDHPQVWVQVDSGGGASTATWAMPTAVARGFFEAFDAQIVAGRGLTSADAANDARVVVVNEHFVERFLGGRNAVGRRVRYTTRYAERSATGEPRGLAAAEMREPGEWYEIVGVVRGLGMDTNRDPFYSGSGPGVYHPLTPAAVGGAGSYAVRMALHVRGEPASFAPRLRELAHAVRPELRLQGVLPMNGPIDRSNQMERITARVFSWGTAMVALIALLISVAGTYSVLSFTVSRRTREIGIRVALGADRKQIVRETFARTMRPMGIGVVVGALAWLWIAGDELDLLVISALLLVIVGLVACGVPVRRALRIEPTEAFREVG